MLRIAMVMALELGDAKLIKDLREQMSERFAGDLDMINFQREKLGGQVFGAPFCGTFKRSDGTTMRLPGDALGKINILYFWSQEDPAEDHVKRLAAEWKKQKDEIGDRLNIVSFNVDELPDAGEKILRDLGVDWPALHLPDGRDNPLYKTFPKRDPYMMTMTPTGYVALIMSGSTRKRATDTGKTDFERWFQSTLARDWSRQRYTTQLTSLFAGDFLVADPEGPFDPTLPPEIKAIATSQRPLKRHRRLSARGNAPRHPGLLPFAARPLPDAGNRDPCQLPESGRALCQGHRRPPGRPRPLDRAQPPHRRPTRALETHH